MKEIKGDIFDILLQDDVDAICITTNGITNSWGQACMGAGTAGEAARRWPEIREVVGKRIKKIGNTTSVVGMIMPDGEYKSPYNYNNTNYKCLIVSFPTKNHFKDPAIPELIKSSAEELVKLANYYGWKKIIIPAPGIGKFTGKLSYESDVKPLINDILDDRFFITFLEGK